MITYMIVLYVVNLKLCIDTRITLYVCGNFCCVATVVKNSVF